MLATYQLTQRIMAAEHLGLETYEETLLLIAAIVHDQAESITGDITYGDKTIDDTASEQELFRTHIEVFVPHASTRERSLIAKAVDEIIFDDTTKLGQIFNNIERIGYVETAVRAYRESTDTSIDPLTRKGLLWLTADVLHNQIEALTPQPIAQDFLKNNLIISDAYTNMPEGIFSLYGKKEPQKRAQFAGSSAAWHAWLKSSSVLDKEMS